MVQRASDDAVGLKVIRARQRDLAKHPVPYLEVRRQVRLIAWHAQDRQDQSQRHSLAVARGLRCVVEASS